MSNLENHILCPKTASELTLVLSKVGAPSPRHSRRAERVEPVKHVLKTDGFSWKGSFQLEKLNNMGEHLENLAVLWIGLGERATLYLSAVYILISSLSPRKRVNLSKT